MNGDLWRMNMWKIFLLTLAASVLFLSAVAPAPAGENGKTSGRGFSRPEEALVALVNCLRKDDIPAALELFAGDEEAAKFKFPEYVARIHVIFPSHMGPSDYPGFEELNRAHMRAQAAGEVRSLVYSLLLPEEEYKELLDGKPFSLPDDALAAGKEFVAALNPAGLKNLAIQLIVPKYPEEPEKQEDMVNRKTFKKAVGFEDSRQFMIFYELNGDFFSGAATLYQYDGKWLIHSLASSLLSTYKPGRVQKMTQQQVDFVFN